MTVPWTPDAWRRFPIEQEFHYPDETALGAAAETLRRAPPLVTSFEVERLKQLLAEAQEGKRFVLQGGDCAETLEECEPDAITSKLKILLQMSLVLLHGARRPIVRIGRLAGQYAKPRSLPTETRIIDGREVTLPNYFGDLINHAAFTEAARRADPALLVEGYKHAAMTLNFVRSLTDRGFADTQHPEYWDLSLLSAATLPEDLRQSYASIIERVSEALHFMAALSEKPVGDVSRVELYTSHEGLNLHYEAAQTRRVPRREGYYDLSAHLPWIGDRTRRLDGAHVEFFRGIRNPVGVKLGPSVAPGELLSLLAKLNPDDEPGKIVLITRMGAGTVDEALPPLVDAVRASGRRVLWICDPMHGNTRVTQSGRKTRSFEAILAEVEATMAVHERCGTYFGGVHFELTGHDVTECTGGADGLTESDLARNYTSACDPRLNYRQALEMSFRIARDLR